MSTVLAAHALTRTFEGGAGIRGVDLAVAAGEIHAIVGLNGAGKTTLLRTLLGMLKPQSGTVTIWGVPLSRVRPGAWSRVGHLVEQSLGYGDLSTRDNLQIAARLHGLTRAEAGAAGDAIIAELRLGGYEDVRARRLSSGNRQRLSLAAALQHRPRLILLDEPTSTLDPAGVVMLRELLRARAATGAGILVSSHHLDEVARIADRVSVVNAGRIIGNLDPDAAELERTFFDLVLADDLRRDKS